MNKIQLATHDQVILMVCELQGQISDGYWENARPLNHWKAPSGAEVVQVDDPDQVGVTFWTQRKYNFASPQLLEYVGGRMLTYVKMSRLFPQLSTSTIRYCDSGEWLWNEPVNGNNWYEKVLNEFKAVGINTYKELQKIQSQVDADQSYTMKHLRKDLKAINEAFKKHIQ